MQQWSVVSTVRGPKWQVEAFIQHYLQMGADEIFIYFDDPEISHEIEIDKVKSIICDDNYWRGKKPAGLEDRQRFNATRAKNRTITDWIIHCDIDELCWSISPISDILTGQPENVGGLVVSPWEAVYSREPTSAEIYKTCFFKRFGSEADPKRYAAIASALFPKIFDIGRCGMWGHVQGKSFIRKKTNPGRMPLHQKKNDVPGIEMRRKTSEIILRHYDTMSYALWQDKHMRRISNAVLVPNAGKFRKKQQDEIILAHKEHGMSGIRAIYLEMAVLPPELLIKGIEAGFICVIPPEDHLTGC